MIKISKKSNDRSTTSLGAEHKYEFAEEAVCCFIVTYICLWRSLNLFQWRIWLHSHVKLWRMFMVEILPCTTAKKEMPVNTVRCLSKVCLSNWEFANILARQQLQGLFIATIALQFDRSILASETSATKGWNTTVGITANDVFEISSSMHFHM